MLTIKLVILTLSLFAIAIFSIPTAFAEVNIPNGTFTSYKDTNGYYTIVGVIKNSEEFAVKPIITAEILDGNDILSRSFDFAVINPQSEMPFKLKIPQVKNENPIINSLEVSHVKTEPKKSLGVEVIYDETLVTHNDGHVSGRIVNNGESAVSNIKVLALIHGASGKLLDMGQNMQMISKVEPGEIREFSIYPDPTRASEVSYYSCFALSDDSIVPIITTRNEEKFYFRYDSASWFAYPKFSDNGKTLTMTTLNSWPLETYANFELPRISDDEEFHVYLNDEPIDFIQSMDEAGNWHVAFNMEPYADGTITITGFEEGKPEGSQISILNWIMSTAGYWSNKEVNNEDFISAIRFMLREEIIQAPEINVQEDQPGKIPEWVRNNAGWWSEGKITDDDFLQGIQYLLQNKIIIV